MKNLLLIICCCLLASSYAQIHSGDKSLHFKTSFGSDQATNYQNYSIGAEWLVSDHIGLNYNIDFVHRTDYVNQLHGSVGMLAGPLIIGLGSAMMFADKVSGDTSRVRGGLTFIGGILLLILPEGASYHFPVSKTWDMAPYANILGVDFIDKNTKDTKYSFDYLRYTATFGCKINHWNPKDFSIFSFVETRKTAGFDWTFGAGIGIGKTFRSEKT